VTDVNLESAKLNVCACVRKSGGSKFRNVIDIVEVRVVCGNFISAICVGAILDLGKQWTILDGRKCEASPSRVME